MFLEQRGVEQPNLRSQSSRLLALRYNNSLRCWRSRVCAADTVTDDTSDVVCALCSLSITAAASCGIVNRGPDYSTLQASMDEK